MGDGKTHINRDNYIHQKEEEIRTLEKDFLENPDVPTAKNLIEQYYIYSSIKMGYYSSPRREEAHQKISTLEKFINKKLSLE